MDVQEVAADDPRKGQSERQGSRAYFHECPPDPTCRHCAHPDPAAEWSAWSFLDAAYCISLQERDDRMFTATAELHRVGLCRHVRFYRPVRHDGPAWIGIWESHRAVARHALENGQSRVLILEDDVQFSWSVGPRRVRAVARALERLPEEWWIFYLGHWPVRARIVRRNIVATVSACTHAYVAGPSLLDWLSKSDPAKVRLSDRWADFIGRGIDAAFTQLPGSYAYFPMIAVQSSSPSDHLPADKRGRIRKLRHLISHTRAREFLLSILMRPNELYVVAASPLHALLDRLIAARRQDIQPGSPPMGRVSGLGENDLDE